MIADDAESAPLLRRDLRRGAVAGLVVGVVLAAVCVLADFPEWTRTMWSFVLIAAVILLPMALAIRIAGHGMHRLSERGIPRERRTRTQAHVLSLLVPGNVAGAAAIVAYLLLLVAFVLGDDGRTTPF